MILEQQRAKLLNIALAALAADARSGSLVDEALVLETVRTYALTAAPQLDVRALDSIIDEITTRFNVWTGHGGTLIGDDPGHLEWLSGRKNDVKWRFWERYERHLLESLPPAVVHETDVVTDDILGQLEDPQRSGSWRRQGLVVGHVQSGKTGNYTGLICKAADAGYRVIIVLSGIHNSLRAQTQIRLDEGFLGYTQTGDKDHGRVRVGVGLLDGSLQADTVTSRAENGDFRKVHANNFHIHAGGNVLLFVVKKNATVLKNLIEWARLSAHRKISADRSVVGDVPLLVVDDEADQASVDTKVQPFDEKGQPDLDHDPRTINRLIRKLLETFERRAYVGYTATPFANVFVHPHGRTEEGGDDLFPKHFIVNLSAPSNYFGPANVFGDGESLPQAGRSPSRVRFVDDADTWAPPSHKSDLVPRYDGTDSVPPSLERAVLSFILASAARRSRGEVTAHKSMLVHVTRFTAVQEIVHRQVSQLVDDVRTRWRARKTSPGDPLLSTLRDMWEADFVPTSRAHETEPSRWDEVEQNIWPILELLRVNLINARASDALIYQEHRQTGLHVIAIGGDKLSRGLTLEGLTVSYFLRSSRMYDTLMQMGRWFGYRPGYEDLCRLYLTEELEEWYGHITEAAEELRQEFDRMVLVGGTPEDYGLRVREHPVMAITGKLRPGLPVMRTSLSATPFEPTVFRDDANTLISNWELTSEFLSSLGPPSEAPVVRPDEGLDAPRGSWPGALLWDGVEGNDVRDLLRQFTFADNNLTKTPSTTVVRYIEDRLEEAELDSWTVVALGKGSNALGSDSEPSLPVAIGGTTVYTLYRERLQRSGGGLHVVKRVGSPKDESIDLSSDEWARVQIARRALSQDPQRPSNSHGRLIREARSKQRGLLILYLLTPPTSDDGERAVPLVAPYASFPHSPTAKAVEYRLSYVYWEQELGGVE